MDMPAAPTDFPNSKQVQNRLLCTPPHRAPCSKRVQKRTRLQSFTHTLHPSHSPDGKQIHSHICYTICYPTPDLQNQSALDSFAVPHPTPNPHAFTLCRTENESRWTRFLLFTLRPTPTLRPHATPDQQNESALDSFAVVHLRPTPTPDRKRVRVGLVFCCSPYAQPPRYALTLRPTNKTSPLWTRLRSFIYAQYTCRTENESALDSFSGVHPTPNPHATPDRQNESALDSFAVVHPTPNPHAGQKTSPRWTRFLAFTLRPTHTLCPTDKTSPLWTRLRSFTLRPTHTPDRKRVRVGLVFWRSPYAQPPRYALTLRPTHTLCPTDKTSPLWTRLRSFIYAQPPRQTENKSALDSFSGVHPMPDPHATPSPYAQPTRYARLTKRVRFGLVCGRSSTPNPHAGQKTSPRWTRFLAFTLHPTHTLRPTHTPDRKRVRIGLVFWQAFAHVLCPTHLPNSKRVQRGLVCSHSPTRYTPPTRPTAYLRATPHRSLGSLQLRAPPQR
ncbi:hypothetical protein DFH05DRAFT_1527063 [Lentinula detonsa]|uniref:Uncharacterized protein n=1 Tax=Lentinula detonsa TaxID=2804962 RepID=A0A9W8NX98_9AGAR|nr:hypothetical protein DFH05DRAFT_1527063 [Lentinula detonsa]